MIGVKRNGPWSIALLVVAVAVAFFPLPASALVPFPKLMVLLIFAALTLLSVRHVKLERPANTLDSWVIWAYLVFAAAMLARALVMSQRNVGVWGIHVRLNGAIFYVAMAVLLWRASALASAEAARTLVRAIVVAGGLTSLYGGLQALGIDVITWAEGGLLSSLGNPDHTASFHALTSVAALWVCSRKDERIEWRFFSGVVALGSLGMVGYWYVYEVAQGALLVVLALGTIATAILWRRGHRAALLLLAGGTVVVLAPLVYYIAQTDRGVLDRIYLGATGLKMWKANPLFGVGVSRLMDLFNQFRVQKEIWEFGLDRVLDDVHNLPIQLLATAGLFGFLPFAAFCVAGLGVSVRTLLTSPDGEITVEQLLAVLFGMWFVQSIYSPDSAAITTIGLASLGMLIGLQRQRSRPTAVFVEIPRWATLTAGLVLAAVVSYRTTLELVLVEVDSRPSRLQSMTSTVHTQAVNQELVTRLNWIMDAYPPDPAFAGHFATRLGARGLEAQAERYLLRSLASDSLDYPSADVLSRVYERQGRLREGREMVRLMTVALPHDPRTWMRRGMFSGDIGDTTDARFSFAMARQAALYSQHSSASFWRTLRRTNRRLEGLVDSTRAEAGATKSSTPLSGAGGRVR